MPILSSPAGIGTARCSIPAHVYCADRLDGQHRRNVGIPGAVTCRFRTGAYNAAAMTFYDRTLARMSRRDLMKIVWMLGTAAIAPPVLTRRPLGKPLFDAYPFTLGVASGDPLPDGVVLWTRLAPDPLAADGSGGMPPRPVRVEYEVAGDERFRSVVRRGSVVATPQLAHSVHPEVHGLAP